MSGPFSAPETDHFHDLWSRQDGRCRLCGKTMFRNRFEAAHATLWKKWRVTFDHVQPKSRGGSDDRGNLQLVHAVCNRRKGNRI